MGEDLLRPLEGAQFRGDAKARASAVARVNIDGHGKVGLAHIRVSRASPHWVPVVVNDVKAQRMPGSCISCHFPAILTGVG
eukprot:CAMPEP_0196719856 /NCGR_PEP_ID=MMETSP1091-20130531/2779_1 /TAXON_ID=302021 /ORGANISM="Rhodomonas sp., Strain CCMP768" /LENGTH=80 /DNA_ID=CAMNT_0042060931 /DNA_START=182 /DNA_END=424 /DNA_ORIENTATION=-